MQIQGKITDSCAEMMHEEPERQYQSELCQWMVQEGLKPGVAFRGAQCHIETAKDERNTGKEQQRPADAVQDRYHCGQGLPDFQQIKIFGTLFWQFRSRCCRRRYCCWRMITLRLRLSLDRYCRGYNHATIKEHTARSAFRSGGRYTPNAEPKLTN